MITIMTKNHREVRMPSGKFVEVCDVIEVSPEWINPREVVGMQGIDVDSARRYIDQKKDWSENWTPGW